jgi:proline iminopeptidase
MIRPTHAAGRPRGAVAFQQERFMPRASVCRALSLAALFALALCPPVAAQQAAAGLFPEIEPYDSGYLKVSDLHEIYYEQVGNPRGKPILYLHGGPGAGCSPLSRRLFDPQKFRVVLHDQRGAGRSRPFAEARENTTQELVGDIEKLREHLKLDKFVILGGSWGSTLALAYAEAHPEHVAGLILRGIYLATREEMESFYGDGVAAFFPEVAERLWQGVPEMPGKTRPQRLLALLESPDAAVRGRVAHDWAAYETKVSRLVNPDDAVEASVKGSDPLAFSRIENHYMAHDCFLAEGQLLRDAGKLRDIPAILVNGRYDVICPPKTAYRLHQALPKSQLWIVEAAGHGGEPAILEALLRAVKTFE